MYASDYLTLAASGRKIHYIHAGPRSGGGTPVVAIHGLGGSSSFWLPAFLASDLAKDRFVVAYDFDGHGQTEFSGRDQLSVSDLAQDLLEVLEALRLERIVLVGHSMNGIVCSLFAEKYSKKVEKLVLLHPVRNMGAAGVEAMQKRAKTVQSGPSGQSEVANAVSSSAVSKKVFATNKSAVAFIRHLVLNTNPKAYAKACIAITEAPQIHGDKLQCNCTIIGGEEDYLAGPEAVKVWASEIPQGKGKAVVLKDVGHWGSIEAPQEVGNALKEATSRSSYYILLGTFRSPYLYTFSFDLLARKLQLLHTNTAVGGHSWLDLSPDRRTLYTTCWTTPPSVASYAVLPSSGSKPFPTTKLHAAVSSKNLSGYVCSNAKAMYSACGPQVDVFLLDEKTGALLNQEAVQSFSLVSEEDRHKGTSQMDFGGLRHGGHSCDLSPDGTKLYVADIGRNCVWLYHVDLATGRLTEGSKNIAKRGHDGPRHAWPHPNGKIVYSLQEHSSYVDVLQLTEDGHKLEWLEGATILPEGDDCHLYWADEVRLSPSADTLFGSTRGLEAKTKGHVAAWPLLPNGRLAKPEQDAAHRIQTRTSGGWANAIAVCPEVGRSGEVFLTLTDSEEGYVQILSYEARQGFTVVDEVKVSTEKEHNGASVAVWL